MYFVMAIYLTSLARYAALGIVLNVGLVITDVGLDSLNVEHGNSSEVSIMVIMINHPPLSCTSESEMLCILLSPYLNGPRLTYVSEYEKILKTKLINNNMLNKKSYNFQVPGIVNLA